MKGADAPLLNLEAVARAVGVDHVQKVDTWDRKAVNKTLREAIAYKGPSVVIAQGPCQRLPEMKQRSLTPYYIDEALCTQCDACFKVWCPAITRTKDNYPIINPVECTACTVCAQVCPPEAIYPHQPELIQIE